MTSSLTSIARALALAALVVSQGCILNAMRGTTPQPGSQRGYGRDGAAGNERSLVDGLGSKPVTGKEAPTRLIARDGSRCDVSKKKYDSTIVGTTVWCVWVNTTR